MTNRGKGKMEVKTGSTRFRANPACPYCHGSGMVVESVPYGDTWVSMPAGCSCVEPAEVIEDDQDSGDGDEVTNGNQDL